MITMTVQENLFALTIEFSIISMNMTESKVKSILEYNPLDEKNIF